jgi:signal transduction histidine kinase
VSTALALLGWTAAGLALLARLTAGRASSVRMEAVRHACHELRGPLTAVRLGLELEGQNGTLPPSRLRAIDLELGRAALALQDLDGVDSGPALRGLMHLRCDEIDVRELLSDSVEAWRAAAERRGATLHVMWSGPLATVTGDRLRLAQATGNLIANAIEHGAGPVEVRGRREGHAVRLEVIDAGPGLGAPLAGLGAPLAELGGRRRRRQPERGRGLTIVARIVSAHGGRLSSAPSARGARLVIELPLARGRPG